jgi:hypothetical protein
LDESLNRGTTQQFQDVFGWPTDHRTPTGDHDGSLNEDGMLVHCSDQGCFGHVRVIETLRVIRCFFLSHQFTRAQVEHFQEAGNDGWLRCRFQIENHLRLDALSFEQRQGLPGLRAARIVIDGDLAHVYPHWLHHRLWPGDLVTWFNSVIDAPSLRSRILGIP